MTVVGSCRAAKHGRLVAVFAQVRKISSETFYKRTTTGGAQVALALALAGSVVGAYSKVSA